MSETMLTVHIDWDSHHKCYRIYVFGRVGAAGSMAAKQAVSRQTSALSPVVADKIARVVRQVLDEIPPHLQF